MVLLTINLGTIYTVYISIPDYIAAIKTLLLSGLGVQVVNWNLNFLNDDKFFYEFSEEFVKVVEKKSTQL